MIPFGGMSTALCQFPWRLLRNSRSHKIGFVGTKYLSCRDMGISLNSLLLSSVDLGCSWVQLISKAKDTCSCSLRDGRAILKDARDPGIH